MIGINGVVAVPVHKGDKALAAAYGMPPSEEAPNDAPTVVLRDCHKEIRAAA